jgi:hypothetical protein
MSSTFSMYQKQQSLSQLLHIRDEKRKTLRRLFDEKKRIQQQMDEMNEDLLALDDRIEALEEEQENGQQQQGIPYVKHEGSEDLQSGADTLTMNVEEILTEQPLTMLTQHQQQQPQSYDEQLTDPITWTQTQEVTPPLHPQQQRDPSDDPEHDFVVYTNDEERELLDRSTRHHATPQAPVSSRASDVRRRVIPALPPLQVQTVDRRPAAATNPRETAIGNRTLDCFLVPSDIPRIAMMPLATTTTTTKSAVDRRPAAATTISSAESSAVDCPFSQNDILRVLNRSFRIQSFRENQLEVIQSTLSGKDCFVLMKTGGGKSLVSLLLGWRNSAVRSLVALLRSAVETLQSTSFSLYELTLFVTAARNFHRHTNCPPS